MVVALRYPQLHRLDSPGQLGRMVPSGQPHSGQRGQSKIMPWSRQRSHRNSFMNSAPQKRQAAAQPAVADRGHNLW